MALFVLVWVVVRTTSCEISMILGMIFDLGIPLQYQSELRPRVHGCQGVSMLTADDDSLARTHQRHLSDYWPIFVIASMVEVAGFLFFHPDLLTLCVCLKTTGCLALWLSRRSDGSKVSTKLPTQNFPAFIPDRSRFKRPQLFLRAASTQRSSNRPPRPASRPFRPEAPRSPGTARSVAIAPNRVRPRNDRRNDCSS